jgi:Icc-related predicted phosphoesterase
MASEEEQVDKLNCIPEETNIIVSHGPPYGIGDPSREGESVGSKALLKRMDELPNLQLVVCGHLHSGYGTYKHKDITVVNAALLDEDYRMVREPVVIELEKK